MLEIVGIGVGETVVVQGSGPVGLASAMYAQLAGAAKTIIVGGPANRLELAREIGVGDVHIDIFASTDPRSASAWSWPRRPVVAARTWCWSAPGCRARCRKGSSWCAATGATWCSVSTPTGARCRSIRTSSPVSSSRSTAPWAFAEPQYARYVSDPAAARRARFDLSRLVTRYPLEESNRAMTEMASGAVMKAVLVPDATTTE